MCLSTGTCKDMEDRTIRMSFYPFPVNTPYIPSENPTRSYIREFLVPEDRREGKEIRIRFDGVDSAFHVFVNGMAVGYSQESRNPAEFDITSFLNADVSKKNQLLVRVYQWCDGSYIEDQDQWWLSGELNISLA